MPRPRPPRVASAPLHAGMSLIPAPAAKSEAATRIDALPDDLLIRIFCKLDCDER